MGVLRFLLALAVLVTHSSRLPGFHLPHGDVAVQAFFVISGFYMSLILIEKYKGPSSYRLFLTNRLLRIFPTYLIVLLATILLGILARGDAPSDQNAWIQQWSAPNPFARALLAITNFGLFGQDLVMFLGVHPQNGSLYFTGNFWRAPSAAAKWLLAPQAWSVALELVFYLAAPFIIRRRVRVILGVFAASEAVRLALALSGRYQDPWSYRFFPSELGTFLAGALAFRLYLRLRRKNYLRRAPAIAVTAIMLLFVIEYNRIPISHKRLILLPAMSACLPFIFHLTRNFVWDRYIGDLSYPFYIVQWLILGVLSHLGAPPTPVVLAVSTLIAAMLLLKFVDGPLDQYRQRRLATVIAKRKKLLAAPPDPGLAPAGRLT